MRLSLARWRLLGCLGAALQADGVCTRRNAISIATASLAYSPLSPARASTKETIFGIGNAERCENGEGEACARLADGNELVAKLQARSAANKEKNAAALIDKTVMQLGYSDFFDALDKNLVKLPNGKYATLDADEYSRLRKEGKLKLGAIDELIGEDLSTTLGEAAKAPERSSMSYSELIASLKMYQVEGMFFQPPDGSRAYALIGEMPVRVSLDATWKREETANLLERLGLPNNWSDLKKNM